MSPFPHPSEASPDGLLAVGGALTPDWLLTAYSEGIFPWFEDDDGPVMWWSPDPRAVTTPGSMRVTRSLAQRIRRGGYVVSMDRAFNDVITGCAQARATTGTWITKEMIRAYTELHELGFAHSVETWQGSTLVGGLYGLSIGRMFFGESMFAGATDASKVAFAALHAQLQRWQFDLIDCQLPNPHLESLGVETRDRASFLKRLAGNDSSATRRGAWQLDDDWAETALAMRSGA